jgi:SAM-dependent methyltransferase
LEREIPVSRIIERYKKELNIDVEKFFHGIDTVGIYKCPDTGYRFYSPSDITGDDSFYQQLEKFPWYYMDWKWEHGVTEKLVKKGDKVLEIGCAEGSFLKKIKENGATVEGLEINSAAMKRGTAKGLSIHPYPIETFAKEKQSVYDMVCSFQVMEHVTDIKAFVEASLSVLKPGGKMVISVPNNDCLMFQGEDTPLNMPPHHIGLWDMNSLIKLQDNFDIKLEALHLEPLQKYHLGFANKLAENGVKQKIREKIGIFSPIIEKIACRFASIGVSNVSKYIIGHTILIIFRKNYAK